MVTVSTLGPQAMVNKLVKQITTNKERRYSVFSTKTWIENICNNVPYVTYFVLFFRIAMDFALDFWEEGGIKCKEHTTIPNMVKVSLFSAIEPFSIFVKNVFNFLGKCQINR